MATNDLWTRIRVLEEDKKKLEERIIRLEDIICDWEAECKVGARMAIDLEKERKENELARENSLKREIRMIEESTSDLRFEVQQEKQKIANINNILWKDLVKEKENQVQGKEIEKNANEELEEQAAGCYEPDEDENSEEWSTTSEKTVQEDEV